MPKVFGLQPPGLWAEILVGQTGFGSNTVVCSVPPILLHLGKKLPEGFLSASSGWRRNASSCQTQSGGQCTSMLIWKGAPGLMVRLCLLSIPQLPSVTLVTSVWACLASCPISALESPWRAKPAYDRCCHFHSGCGMLDGLAHLWPRVHYSTERGPKSQDPRNSRRKLIPPISWLHGGEESMGKAQKQSIILPFCKLSCPIFEGTHEQGMVRRRDKGEKGPVSLKLYLDSP